MVSEYTLGSKVKQDKKQTNKQTKNNASTTNKTNKKSFMSQAMQTHTGACDQGKQTSWKKKRKKRQKKTTWNISAQHE